MNDFRHLLNQECLEAILASALQIVEQTGIETNRDDLLAKAAPLAGLSVRGRRIAVSRERAQEVLDILRQRQPQSDNDTPEKLHLGVSDRSLLIADHRQRELRPMTRREVVEGTKLIDAMTPKGVVGNTCGTPQESIPELRDLEQYLIGFRYSRNGGNTNMPTVPEVTECLLAIREIAEDGFDRRRRSFDLWVPSPLRLEASALDELLEFDGEVTSFCVGSMPIMGLTGPVDPVGIMTLTVAETLGGAAILHALFPDAAIRLFPHPEPMDPKTGMMAFGTPEWCRLEILQQEIREYLALEPHRMDLLTSSCMPDAQAQADKLAALSFGMNYGITYFNSYPLCTDEAWSPVQFVLDVEWAHSAWSICRPLNDPARAEAAVGALQEAVAEAKIFAQMEDTALNLRKYYHFSKIPRVFSSNQWVANGKPDAIAAAETRAREGVEKASFCPPQDKLDRVTAIYERACKRFGVAAMRFE